jgi:hypothetical protein
MTIAVRRRGGFSVGNPEANLKLGLARMTRNSATATAVSGKEAEAIETFERATKEALQALLVYRGQTATDDDLPALWEQVKVAELAAPPHIEGAIRPVVDGAKNLSEAAIGLAEKVIEPAEPAANR